MGLTPFKAFFTLLGLIVLPFFSPAQSLIVSEDKQIEPPNVLNLIHRPEFKGFDSSSSPPRKGFLGSLKEHGLSFGFSETLESYYNFRGGKRSGSAFASTFDVNMNIDLQQLLGIAGGTVYWDLEDHSWDNPTMTLIGDFQVFDKHNAAPFLQILEIWYQQEFFNKKLRVKIGKVDANAEFSVIDNGLEFINSSTQVTPTLFVFPTFPDPMPSINLFFTPNKLVYSNFSVYDANKSDRFLDFYGDPASVQPTLHGELLMSESGLTWGNFPILGNDGNLKLGLWKHTGIFHKFNGNAQDGTSGIYLIFNQTLWIPKSSKNVNRGLRLFLEYTRADSSITPIYKHIGGGLAWTGFSLKRPNDEVGFSAQFGNLSPALNLPYHDEVNLETFYRINLIPWFGLKPDIQYIVHPGGQYPNALVATLLLTLAFNS